MCTWKYDLYKCGHKTRYQRIKACSSSTCTQAPASRPEYVDRKCDKCFSIKNRGPSSAGDGATGNYPRSHPGAGLSCNSNINSLSDNFDLSPKVDSSAAPRSAYPTSSSCRALGMASPVSISPLSLSTSSSSASSSSRQHHSHHHHKYHRRPNPSSTEAISPSASSISIPTISKSASSSTSSLNGRHSPSIGNATMPAYIYGGDQNFVWHSSNPAGPW